MLLGPRCRPGFLQTRRKPPLARPQAKTEVSLELANAIGHGPALDGVDAGIPRAACVDTLDCERIQVQSPRNLITDSTPQPLFALQGNACSESKIIWQIISASQNPGLACPRTT